MVQHENDRPQCSPEYHTKPAHLIPFIDDRSFRTTVHSLAIYVCFFSVAFRAFIALYIKIAHAVFVRRFYVFEFVLKSPNQSARRRSVFVSPPHEIRCTPDCVHSECTNSTCSRSRSTRRVKKNCSVHFVCVVFVCVQKYALLEAFRLRRTHVFEILCIVFNPVIYDCHNSIHN